MRIYALNSWGDTEYFLHRSKAESRLEKILELEKNMVLRKGIEPILANITEEEVNEES